MISSESSNSIQHKVCSHFKTKSPIVCFHPYSHLLTFYYALQTQDGNFYIGSITNGSFQLVRHIKFSKIITNLHLSSQQLFLGFSDGSLKLLNLANSPELRIQEFSFKVKGKVIFADRQPNSDILINIFDSTNTLTQITQKEVMCDSINFTDKVHRIKIVDKNYLDLYVLMVVEDIFFFMFSRADFMKLYKKQYFSKHSLFVKESFQVRGIIVDFAFNAANSSLFVANHDQQIVISTVAKINKKIASFQLIPNVIIQEQASILSLDVKKEEQHICYTTKKRIAVYDAGKREKRYFLQQKQKIVDEAWWVGKNVIMSRKYEPKLFLVNHI